MELSENTIKEIKSKLLQVESDELESTGELEVEQEGITLVVTYELFQEEEEVIGTTDDHGNEERYTECKLQEASVLDIVALIDDKEEHVDFEEIKVA